MSLLLFAHVTALGVWLGVVLVEAIIELQPAVTDGYELLVARLHKKIDCFCEIPAFSTVLVTGLALIEPQRLHGWYLVLVLSGTIAIAINVWCVLDVLRRSVAARAGNRPRVATLSRRIIASGVIGAPFAITAAAVGLSLS